MSTSRTPHPVLNLLADPHEAECECGHRDRPDGRCGVRAQVRVTVVCIAEGCDCSAGVYTICRECLSVWRRNARRDGVRLRVKPI
jgi:hypothetical protein